MRLLKADEVAEALQVPKPRLYELARQQVLHDPAGRPAFEGSDLDGIQTGTSGQVTEVPRPMRFVIREPVLRVPARGIQQSPLEGVGNQMANLALRGRGQRVLPDHALQ